MEFFIQHLKYRLPAVMAIVFLMFLPSDGLDINICWFQLTFDVPCPACGLTRGMSSLLHFELYKSYFYHPLALLVLSYLIILAFTGDVDFLKKQVSEKYKPGALFFSFKSVAFLFIVVWIFRLFKIFLPN